MLILSVVNMESKKIPPEAEAVYLDYLEAIKSDFAWTAHISAKDMGEEASA